MTIETLQERLQQLEDTLTQLRELIVRLDNLDFSAGAVPLSTQSNSQGEDNSLSPADDVSQELVAEISTLLRDEDEELEVLAEEVADLRATGGPGSDSEHARTRLREGVQRMLGEVKTCRHNFRKAQLSARKSLAAAQRRERALLLASYSAPPAPVPEYPTTSPQPPPQPALLLKHRPGRSTRTPTAEVSASSSVTLALRQTHALLDSEVRRSLFAAQTLKESSEALAGLGDKYNDLSGMLKASRALVGGLLKANKSDTWYLTIAAYMLAGTLGWLVFRRLLWGPLWLFVWWPLRVVFGVTWGVGKGVGRVVGGSGKEGANMVVEGGREVKVEMSEGSVPTVSVAGQEKQGVKGDPESMVEKVGKIVDGEEQQEQDGEEAVAEDAEAADPDAPNTKKRMWEEEREAPKQAERERVKDEL